jgi:hypothetical protein
MPRSAAKVLGAWRGRFACLAAGVAILTVLVGAAEAEEECCKQNGPQWAFGASTSYTYDFNRPDAPPLGGNANEATYPNLEQDESFNIDLVQLGVSGTRGRVGYGAKVDYGDLARAAGDSTDGDIALQEAYLTYDGDGVGMRIGRFATPIGYEVLEPWGNAHASRSWAWQAQPINHDGLTFGGTADVIDVMIGVVNSFTVADQDILANDVDDEKGVIVSLDAGVSKAFNLYLSGLYTEENDAVDIGVVDVIVSGNLPISDSGLRYAVEGYYRRDNPDGAGADELWSVALYLGHRLGGPFTLSSRIEYFDDEGILLPDTNVVSLTPTLSVELVDGVDFRIEYRFDKSDDDVFLDESSGEDTIHTLSGQLVWSPTL